GGRRGSGCGIGSSPRASSRTRCACFPRSSSPMTRGVVVASNRGPVAFARDESGGVIARRGAGGLVTALSGALATSGGLWIASAMTDEDRRVADRGRVDVEAEGADYRLRYLSFDPEVFDRYYNGWTNQVLWFLHHYLWDTP